MKYRCGKRRSMWWGEKAITRVVSCSTCCQWFNGSTVQFAEKFAEKVMKVDIMCERKKSGTGPINDLVVSERTKLIASLLFCLVTSKVNKCFWNSLFKLFDLKINGGLYHMFCREYCRPSFLKFRFIIWKYNLLLLFIDCSGDLCLVYKILLWNYCHKYVVIIK